MPQRGGRDRPAVTSASPPVLHSSGEELKSTSREVNLAGVGGLTQLRLAHWPQAIVDDMEDIAVACIEHQ